MSALTAGIFAFGFNSCSDNFDSEAYSYNGPKAENAKFINLEQYSYSVPVNVNIAGDWEIDFQFSDEDHHFCYALPRKGYGPQTIKLCMLDNWTETRNEGEMIIRDLSNSQNDQSLHLVQKCNLDNPEFLSFRSLTRGSEAQEGDEKKDEAPVKNKGDIVTAVGYGYNANMAPGVKAISSRPIIALEALREAGNANKANYGPVFRKGEFSISVESYAGNNINDISNTMSNTATLKGSRAGFNAEASATFTQTQKSGSNNMYCLTVANVNVGQAMLQGLDRNNFRDYMTEDAKNAINGTGNAYKTGNEGFKQLIKDYGSHLIIRTDLGGRLRYGATIDRKYCSNTNELKAHASMNYKNTLMETNAKSSDEYKSTYERTKSHISINVCAAGGSTKATAALAANDTTQNINEWIASLESQENLAVINFNNNESMEMWPLYELVDDHTTEGACRKEALKTYMMNGQMELDFFEGTPTYNQGEIIRLSFPADWTEAIESNSANQLSGSLIREARYQGKTVAWFCMEYIPSINPESLIPVVYPVQSNRPNFQAGRFIGAPGYKACDISWNSNGTCNVSMQAAQKGMNPELFIHANNLYTSQPWGIVENPQIQDKVLTAKKADASFSGTLGTGNVTGNLLDNLDLRIPEWDESWVGNEKYNANYKYPLVKIGNHVWMRENYYGQIPHGADKQHRNGIRIDNGIIYFTSEGMHNASIPAGWHIAKSIDFNEVKAVMSNDGEDHMFGERMQKDGASGFNLEWNGWYIYSHKHFSNNFGLVDWHMFYNYKLQNYQSHHATFLTGDDHVYGIKDDTMNGSKLNGETYAMNIRLVMDL